MRVKYITKFLLPAVFLLLGELAAAQTIGVWPGDANNDGVVNNIDLLYVGKAFNTQGNVRTGATPQWLEQTVTAWSSVLPDSTNYAYSDCDGNGFIDTSDADVIRLNYGQAHAVPTDSFISGDSTNPALYLAYSPATGQPGQPFEILITLGDPNARIDSFFGIAFTLNYDTTLIEARTPIHAEFNSRWAADPNNGDPLFIVKDRRDDGKLDIAISLKGMSGGLSTPNAAGYGNIASLSFIIEDNLIGKTAINHDFMFSFDRVRMVDRQLSQYPVYAKTDTFTVLATGIQPRQQEPRIDVYPNPAEDHITIHAPGLSIQEAVLYDMLGKVIKVIPGTPNDMLLEVNNLSKGLYILQIKTDKGTVTKKISVKN
jgi:hypothetical protein